ncbi:MAG: septal ring lytic transglycosylase RlpA family protein [Solirubrobacteraceae bacterium]
MRPQPNPRVLGAMMALAALTAITILSVSAATAHSQAARPASVADIQPRRSVLNVLAGRRASVAGTVAPGNPGARVSLQKRHGSRWTTVARTATRAGGAFRVSYRPPRPQSASLRIVAGGHPESVGRLNAYRHATVSWYGPGLYGNKLGCGGRLTPSTIGVANKSLPCGTRLTLRKGSHIVRARVVDRGPYVGGREFDLTSATRRRLHFSGVGTIGVTR